jgi:hypothetical protein
MLAWLKTTKLQFARLLFTLIYLDTYVVYEIAW